MPEIDYEDMLHIGKGNPAITIPSVRSVGAPPSLFKILSDQEVKLQAAKRADYTGGGRILANYEEAARATGLKTWQVMLSRIYEKLYRFRMLREGPEARVEDETLVDTLLDVAILAKLLIIEKEDASE